METMLSLYYFYGGELLMTLEEIHTALEKLIEEEEKAKKKYLPDAEYNVPTWDNIYDALEAIESIIEFDPTE